MFKLARNCNPSVEKLILTTKIALVIRMEFVCVMADSIC